MYYLDRAINDSNEDILGRKSFAKRLAEFINKYEQKDSYSMGITGKWGSGKTSIINMLKKDLNSNILVYNFNPWDISIRKQLFGDFFSGMSSVLKSKDAVGIKKAKIISNKLKLYSSIFKPLKYIPILAPTTEAISDILAVTSDNLKLYADDKQSDLFGIKAELNKLLEESDKKILIIIDDIDRLSDDGIKDIFHLVKSVGDLKNTFYLLSYDKELITNVLDKVQEKRGKEYIEKLINIEINVPQIKKEDLDIIFKEEIQTIFPTLFEDRYYHYTTVNNLFKYILSDNFFNLREVKRFINILSFSSVFAKKLNIIDFIIIQFLKEYHLDSYNKIKEMTYEYKGESNILNILYRKNDYKFNGREFINPDYRFQYFSFNIDEIPKELLSCYKLQNLIDLIHKDEEIGKRYLKKMLSSFIELDSQRHSLFFEAILNSIDITGNTDAIISQSEIYERIIVFVEGMSNKDEIKRILNDISINEKYSYREFFKFLNNLRKNYSLDIEEVIKKHIKKVLSNKELNGNIIYSFSELNRFKKGLVNKFLNSCFKDESKIFDYLRWIQDEINHQIHQNLIYENGEIVGEDEPEITSDNIIFYEDIESHYSYDKLVILVNEITRDLSSEERELKKLLIAKKSREEYEKKLY